MSSTIIEQKPSRAFRKGGHTAILGWSGLAIDVIREIAIANQNVRKPKIVILSVEPRATIAKQLFELQRQIGKTKVYIQTAEPNDAGAQALINLAGAKSVIDFASQDTVQITGKDGKRVLVYENDLTSGVKAHAAKHPSMPAVIGDLLNFEGEEIYFNSLPALTGKTYGDAVLAFNTASVIGVVDGQGHSHLNPSRGTVIGTETLIIAIAEDDDKVVYTGVREDIANRFYSVNNPATPASPASNGAATGVGVTVENVIAKFIAQVSENTALAGIFYELFGADGASLHINAIDSYVALDHDVEYAEMVAIARAHGHSAIGFMAAAAAHEPHGGVWLNPPKSTIFRPLAGDGLVVVSK